MPTPPVVFVPKPVIVVPGAALAEEITVPIASLPDVTADTVRVLLVIAPVNTGAGPLAVLAAVA